MEIIQIVAIGLVAAILSITIKKQSPEFSLSISIAASVIIFIMIVPELGSVLSFFEEMANMLNTDYGFILVIIKVIGIAYITEFGAQLCSDAGETSIASKIELAGKILIMVISMPILVSLVNMIANLLPS